MKEGKTNSDLKIYQIYFRREQLPKLNKLFIPYFKPEFEEPEWREYWTFLKNFRRAIVNKGLLGFVSWKFQSKSGVTPQKFMKFIKDNPGYDVYYLNPFPVEALLFDNVWQHGEYYHPGLTEISQTLLNQTGHKLDLLNLEHGPEQVGYSNYWVANRKFWRAYRDFTRPVEQYIRNDLTKEESDFIYSLADEASNCSHIPFIFERLFTTLLAIQPELKAISYQYDQDDLTVRYSRFGRLSYWALRLVNSRSVFATRMLQRLIILLRSGRTVLSVRRPYKKLKPSI
jgi:hypothetical protein